MPNPEDITDPTTAMNMALALMAKAFKLNYSTPTNNNHRISSNPRNRQIAQPNINMGQDRQMHMVGGNGENEFRQYVGQNVTQHAVQNPRIQNVVQRNANQNPNRNGNLVAARAKGNATGHNADLDEIEEVNANCIFCSKHRHRVLRLTKLPSMTQMDQLRVLNDHPPLLFLRALGFEQVKIRERQDNIVMRYQALKRKHVTEAQERKNMMVYLKNMAGFKMDFFKGMTYSDIRPIFEKHYSSIQAFLEKEEEEVILQEKRQGKSLEQDIAKKQKINEEAKELKTHLQIVANDDDDVYTEATPLASKVPVVNYLIHHENNNPYYKIIDGLDFNQIKISQSNNKAIRLINRKLLLSKAKVLKIPRVVSPTKRE
nr:hypothetical protein [Tanacetum cinerariifolium]